MGTCGFTKCDFDAGFLTTEITETGSLGVRRTPKGLRKLPSDKITAVIPLYWWGFFFFEPCRIGETCSIEIVMRLGNVYRFRGVRGEKRTIELGICLLDDFGCERRAFIYLSIK